MDAVERAIEDGIDYGMLVKYFGAPKGKEARRYSPAECIRTTVVTGQPDMKHASTSYAERQNLSMWIGIRGFTRLTNAFSKEVENHCHSLPIYFMRYNCVRVYHTLRLVPTMAAGVSKTIWSMDDIVRVVQD